MIRKFACIALLTVAPTTCSADDPRGVATDRDVAVLKTSRIECTIGNNKSHRENGTQHSAGYNGLFRMKSLDQSESPFVPAYAGLNLEHYFDLRKRPERQVFFEPRYSAISLKRVSETCVELHQPTTATFGVESWTRFEVRDPYYVDVSFRCIPRRQTLHGNLLGVFWASYINAPLDKSIYFLDAESSLAEPMWRQLCTQQHNRDSTVRGKTDFADLAFDEGGETLFSSISPLRYSESFFYGRFRNMVLIYVFQPNPFLRFTHSPSGGGTNGHGNDTNPAWDFQLIVPDVQIGKEYRLTGRLIYKSWQGRADVLAEVRRFQSMSRENSAGLEKSEAGKPINAAPQSSFHGEKLFNSYCAACHQRGGQGEEGRVPPLNNSPWVSGSEDRLTRIVLNGLRGPIEISGVMYNLEMPAFRMLFKDDDIASILAYVRERYGSPSPPITTETVARVRQETRERMRIIGPSRNS